MSELSHSPSDVPKSTLATPSGLIRPLTITDLTNKTSHHRMCTTNRKQEILRERYHVCGVPRLCTAVYTVWSNTCQKKLPGLPSSSLHRSAPSSRGGIVGVDMECHVFIGHLKFSVMSAVAYVYTEAWATNFGKEKAHMHIFLTHTWKTGTCVAPKNPTHNATHRMHGNQCTQTDSRHRRTLV